MAQHVADLDPDALARLDEYVLFFWGDVRPQHVPQAQDHALNRLQPERGQRPDQPLHRPEREPDDQRVERDVRDGEERGDRARLQDEQRATCESPFDVLRGAIFFLDLPAGGHQLAYLRGRERLLSAGLGADIFHAPASLALGSGRLVPQRLAKDFAAARVGHVMVRLDLSGDQRFAQPEGRVDDRLTQQSAERVGGEEHARSLARHQFLYHHRQRGPVVRDGVAQPVADGARRPQAAPAVDHGCAQLPLADHVQEGVLLTSKGQLGQVFGRGRGAHSHRWSAERAVGFDQRVGDLVRQLFRRKSRSDLGRGAIQSRRIFGREPPERGGDASI